MGDNLPEELYRAWANASGLSYGSDECPSFHNLPTEQREVWEQVAAKARNEMAARFVADLESIRTRIGSFDDLVAALHVVRARWGR